MAHRFAALFLFAAVDGLPFRPEADSLHPTLLLASSSTNVTTKVTCRFSMMEQDNVPPSKPSATSKKSIGSDGTSYAECVELPPSKTVHFFDDDKTTQQFTVSAQGS